jgi:hypothetical protein
MSNVIGEVMHIIDVFIMNGLIYSIEVRWLFIGQERAGLKREHSSILSFNLIKNTNCFLLLILIG